MRADRQLLAVSPLTTVSPRAVGVGVSRKAMRTQSPDYEKRHCTNLFRLPENRFALPLSLISHPKRFASVSEIATT
ncbi:MAG: hypothetical protein IKH45_03640 [Neisseriaceae bacterium]|nr:hypothetical protein [Neisseriaceae bacterium]